MAHGEERRLYTPKHSVKHNADREKEAGRGSGDPAQRGNHSTASSQEHRGHEDVRHQAEYKEDDMRNNSIASLDDLEEGMGVGCSPLQPDVVVSRRPHVKSSHQLTR